MESISTGYAENLAKAWELFVTKGVIADIVRPIIARSWERSRGLDPNTYHKPLSKDMLYSRQKHLTEVIAIARPIMREICRVAGRNYIELFDRNGYSLEGFGNSVFPPVIGFNCNEKAIGTNAIGIVLEEDIPIEMKGAEHYASWLHSFCCVAAPIHDSKGNILAVINITNPYGGLPPWTFNIMCLGAQLIENQLNNRQGPCEISNLRNTFLSIAELLDGVINSQEQSCGCSALPHQEADMEKQSLHWYSCREDLVGKNISKFFVNIESAKAVSISPGSSDELEHSLGVNPCWTEIKKTIVNAARFNPNVLIEGETGTGKEVIARTIHHLSGRKGQFVAINCGAIPQELIQSELYGYEEGSFTGAKKGGSIGKFELADQGTIFLDEIGEMPLNMQVNLLRFLQDKTISRVGSHRLIPLDVQIIAATNRNLEQEVEKGSFRADLYYRLNVINIYLPPLRERKDDIPWLIDSFLKEIGRQYNCELAVSSQAVEALKNYDWPGNVRELRNALERSFINSRDKRFILLEDLPAFLSQPQSSTASKNRGQMLHQSEREKIEKVLKECRGNVSLTAKTLKISRVTLYKKLKELNISWNL